MAFTEEQAKRLTAKLSPKHVKTREANGARLFYIEGWHAITEANRIFGYDAWDRATLSVNCVWSGMWGQFHACAYTARARIRVRAGDLVITREGTGTGEGKGRTPGEAHDIALKSAETDATKRALATFGNPFGLALYDKELRGVRCPAKLEAKERTSWTLRSRKGAPAESYDKPELFAEALKRALSRTSDITTLFDIWEQNVDIVRALNKLSKQAGGSQEGLAKSLVEYFKARAIACAKAPETSNGSGSLEINGRAPRSANGSQARYVDKSALHLSEPKRIRSKEHLRHVAKQPCLVCGRNPSQAHHLRFAQPRAMARKVSDEFTVPLCAIHHTEVHHAGDEKVWWEEKSIEPLSIAKELWNADSDTGRRADL